MFERLFKPDPDAIVCRSRAGAHAPKYFRLFNLMWTLWVFADLFLGGDIGPYWYAATLISFPLFLALYYCANMRSRRHLGYYAGAIALLGYAVMPFNHSGGACYFIYSCAYFSYYGALRQSVAAMAVAAAVFALWSQYQQWPLVATIAMLMVAVSVGAGNLFYRINSQKDAELRLSHDEVRKLAATAERERIGRDLHDLLGHTLSLITLKSELANRLFERDAQAARREIAEVERVARDALAQVRRAVSGIRTAGLAAELASAKLLLESNGIHFNYTLAQVMLTPQVETVMAMCIREAATNAQRHSRATQVNVTLEQTDDRLLLKIVDNGRGGAIVPGNGLTGMRERLVGIDAELNIDSQRGQGTTLNVSLPTPEQPPLAPVVKLRQA